MDDKQPDVEAFDYHTLAMRTAAGPEVFHTPPICKEHQPVLAAAFFSELVEYIDAARRLDCWKSMFFYGKQKPMVSFDDILNQIAASSDTDIDLDVIPRQMLHAILGVASEAGELAEDMFRVMVASDEDERKDALTNMVRENGDVDWFQELLAHSLGVPVEQSRRENIARLQRRFPDKFSEADAVERKDEMQEAPIKYPAAETHGDGA